jgi:hypothetical protein
VAGSGEFSVEVTPPEPDGGTLVSTGVLPDATVAKVLLVVVARSNGRSGKSLGGLAKVTPVENRQAAIATAIPQFEIRLIMLHLI